MGTNYYASFHKKVKCVHCEKELMEETPYATLHIGKASAGWQFVFQCYRQGYHNMSDPEYNLGSPSAWLIKLYKNRDTVIINDEYGRTITFEDFKDVVDHKADGEALELTDGTYSYIFNEFS